jgi:lipopolysaccharide export system permease protein
MLKILDRYIIQKFLGTFFFMLGACIIITIIFDVSENIDDLVKSNASFWQIVTQYYLSFAFYFGNLLSSFIIFLTIIWFTSKLAQKTEIVAMLSGGVSYLRILRPYFIASGILVLVSLALSHYVVPMANKVKYDFEVNYIKGALTVAESNIHREIEPGTIAYFYRVNPATNSGSNFSVERWQDGKLSWKLLSSGAEYHPESKTWTVSNCLIRKWYADGSESTSFRQKVDTTFNMTMEDFGLRKEIMNAMTYSELNDFIDYQKRTGSGRASEFEVEKYNRTANPFSIFVLTLIGVSIASRKQRGGTGAHLMFGIIVGFIFVFIARMMTVSAIKVGFPAYIAVWVPNIIFTVVGIVLYRRAQK